MIRQPQAGAHKHFCRLVQIALDLGDLVRLRWILSRGDGENVKRAKDASDARLNNVERAKAIGNFGILAAAGGTRRAEAQR